MNYGSIGTIWAEIGLNTKKLDEGLMKAQLKLAQTDKAVSTFGQKLTLQSTKLITAGGLMAGAVTAVGVATVKMAADFEKSMRNVNSITKLSEKEFANMSGEVIDLSKTLPQSAKVLADGLYDISSSGFAGADGLKVLEASAKAASAGLTTTATSAKGITAVLNAYGLEAEDAAAVSDIMFKTVDKGVISFEELSATVGDWVGMAEAANLSFEEASGAIAYMTTKGIGAAEAGTSFQRVITGIIKPSEEMAEMLRKAGYESGEMALEQLGLAGTMKLVNDATGGSITKLIDLMPEIRGVRGANALLGAGYDELTTYMKEFNNTAGATDTALEEQSKSLDFQLQLLRNNISAISIEIGTKLIPILTQYTSQTSKTIGANDELIASLIIAGGKILLTGAAITAATGAWRKAIVWGQKLSAIFGVIGTAAGLTSGQVGAIVALLIPLAKGLNEATLSLFKASDGTISWGKAIETVIQAITLNPQLYGHIIENWIDAFRGFDKSTKEAIAEQEELSKTLERGQTFVEKYSGSLPNAANEMANLINQFNAGKLSEEAFAIGIDQIREATQNGHKDIKEIAEVTQESSAEFRIMAEESKNAADEVGGLGDEAEETALSVDELRNQFNEFASGLFDGIFSINDSEEALIELKEAQEKVNKLTKEGKTNTDEYTLAVNDVDRANLRVIESFYGITTSIFTTRQEQAKAKEDFVDFGLKLVASAQMGEDSFIRLAKQFGISQQEMSGILETLGIDIETLPKDIQIAIGVDKEEPEEVFNTWYPGLMNQYEESKPETELVLDKEDVETVFGDVDELSKEWIKSEPETKILADNSQAMEAIQKVIDKDIPDKHFNIYAHTIESGSITGSVSGEIKAMGGIVGIPQAASGMVVPQTGREHLIIAHDYETILNTSQQKNIAEWIMGRANSRPEGGVNVPIEIRIPVELDGRIIAETSASFIYDGTQTKLRLGG